MSDMEALLWDGQAYPRGLVWTEVARPEARPGWVVVRDHETGICGSDLHYLSGAMRHQIPESNLPAVLGHENAGTVVEVGDGVEGFAVGDRVALEPLHPCRTQGVPLCPACQVGQYHLCENLGFVGIPNRLCLPGGYGQYSAYHHSTLFHLPESISFEDAAIIDVLACGVHALRMGQATPGHTAVVLGCGAIGLDMLQCLRAVGVRDLVAVARYPFQARVAQQLGATHVVCLADEPDPVSAVLRLTGGVDRVYECVGGASDTVQQAVSMCRPGGRIIVLGFFSGIRPIDLSTVFLKELCIHASDAYSTWGTRREFDMALQLLANNQVDHTPLITHRFRRADWAAALDVAFHKSEHQSIKVVLSAT
jgi:threonine dehydrogenase-like Zn-dependent dehydrogenase